MTHDQMNLLAEIKSMTSQVEDKGDRVVSGLLARTGLALEALQAEVARFRTTVRDLNALQERQAGELDTALARLAALERTLVYTAHMGYAAPQHMLPPGVCLFDGDGVQVKLPGGEMVFAGRTPQYLRDRYAAAGASPVGPTEVIKEIVVHADYREMWRQQLKMNQQLNAALSALPATVQPSQARELSPDDVRAAGGIVHGDGNIFFTNIDKLNAAVNAKEKS